MEKREKAKKRLQTVKDLPLIIAEYYQECHEAKASGRIVGWMPPMNGGIELFYAMGIQPVFPENWSPICAAFGLTERNFDICERMGYSRDLCGYLRNIIGYVHGMMGDPDTPLGGLPEPDIILPPMGGCSPVQKIFQALVRRFPQARAFWADVPQVAVENIKRHNIDYALAGMNGFVGILEEITGRKLDYDRLKEVVRLSDRACELWDEIMAFRRLVPTPISASEIGIMFVMVTRQGTQIAVDFLTRVRDELKERKEMGIGILEDEKVRLFWDNIPLWYNMGLFNYFEKMGGVVVAETYSAAWSLRLDPDNPIESLILKGLRSYSLVSCVSIKRRIEMVVNACREYSIDGAILHRNRSCVPITLGQMDIQRELEKEGIPSLIIDADHMDHRNFSTAQFQTRADAFMEMLLTKKGVSL